MAVEKLKIVYRKPQSLKAYERNARVHPPEQIDQIRASIREFGFTNPILLKDDGETVGAGHGRLEAALAEGLDKVPTITLEGLSEDQWRAYVLADNKIAEGASWNDDILRVELQDMIAVEFNLASIGFTTEDLARLLEQRP